MVKKSQRVIGHQQGAMIVELLVAMAIIIIAMFPLAYTFLQERKLAYRAVQRAVALEIVDGEMEILAAGEWKSFSHGQQPYPLHAESQRSLPAGNAILTITGKRLRLEWAPKIQHSTMAVVREVDLK